ncbi:MAG: hypothetical protein ACLR23_21015 [Clostridia bacterium]
MSEYPIGYRRGRLDYTIGHVTISIPGSFLYRRDAINGRVHHVFYDAEPDGWRRIRIFSGVSEDGNASFIEEMFTLFTDETPEEFPVGNGICRAVSWDGWRKRGKSSFRLSLRLRWPPPALRDRLPTQIRRNCHGRWTCFTVWWREIWS